MSPTLLRRALGAAAALVLGTAGAARAERAETAAVRLPPAIVGVVLDLSFFVILWLMIAKPGAD